MSLCHRSASKISQSLASASSKYRPSGLPAYRPQFRFTVAPRGSSSSTRRAYHFGSYSARQIRRSGSGFYTAVVVFGIAIGGALLLPLAKNNAANEPEKTSPSPPFEYSVLTESYLVMAPNTPPGRPGTLTPEEEGKLRELWAATMKVFGVYEAPAVEANGTENVAPSVASESTEKDGKEKKKKSRLHVFKRNKGDKGDKGDKGEADAAPASGNVASADISSLSIADEDDKHGQTKEFKAAIANTAPEDLRKAFWSMVKHDHPDGLLLRFLRARKWDVEKALIMMISTMHWRLDEMHVDDDLIKNGELGPLEASKSDDAKVKKEAEDFLAQLRMGKSFLHGLDNEGRPMCYVRARLHKAGEQSEESIERFTVYTIETARMLLRPPIDTATIVFDMTDFTLANMDYAPVKFMIKCFEANYPESLGRVLVYKAPWVFNTIWSLIRGWLDPVVAGKVHFAKNVEELEKYVPKSQIPVDLGGDEKWEYKYVEPVAGENAKLAEAAPREELQTARNELVKKYEGTILEWIHEGDKGKGLEERRKERDTVAEELRNNYWKLDPYVRARTLYDRIGVIGEGGKLNFYPPPKKEEPAPAAPATIETSPDDLD
ncbi:CRAL/TRIO domain-containing protein [Corynespora cassiicola Philippines]|uniref:CRAL/TRIO domain-containing protein n=1 Tax=Corynespora cassiicola Philippines TaxID=1448308 RepID=A0A2T2NB38_CORCC|nr:CRAL/TRIO domain-containing protein [Corynespora cassiicola Philippines]